MQWRTGGIGDGDVVVLKAGVDIRFLNLLDQLFVKRLVGVCLLLELPILK